MSENFVIVQIENGRVKGDKRTSALGVEYCNFQGIPFMKPPLGSLRFKAPIPSENWSDVFDASKDCPSYVITEFATERIYGQEDAGCINVFTKNTTPEKFYPVMIHGGGFDTGSSSPKDIGCDYILEKDVVLVSFNYRVGVVGFLSLDDPTLDVPGNAGLKDQTLALKWIKRNISAFGGDSNDITIFGTSAGGASVHYHLISNQSKNLFNRAIAMSGSAFNSSWALHPRRNYPERIAKNLGYVGEINEKDILKFLEETEATKLVEAAMNVLKPEEIFGEQRVFNMGPVIEPYITENTFLPKNPILMAREAWSKDIDVIFGATSNEGLFMNYFIKRDEKYLTYFRDSVYFTPLLDFNLKPTDEKAKEIGKKIKNNYYGYTNPEKMNKQGYFLYSSDHEFWNGINRAILSRLNYGGSGKTFLYRFDILTKLNVIRKMLEVDDYEGVEHGGCMQYLFKFSMLPIPEKNTVEFNSIQRVVDIFTTFASKHDFDETNFADWKKVNLADGTLKAYNLTSEGCEFKEISEYERFKDWIEIYEDVNVDLF